jgi:isopentenyl phosphate kinase
MTAAGRDRPLVLVKLGGAVITRKREVEKTRPKVLGRLAEELAAADACRLGVIHGAGSFGHPGAVRYGLARAPEPGTPPGQRARGAAIVATEVRRLHLAVLRALVHAGAAPASVPPATHARNRAGQLVWFDPTPFTTILAHGQTPVSFGDVVPDEEWGSSILSGDTIAVELTRALHPERVVFVSDVPGVLEGPAHGRPRVIAELTPAVVERMRPAPGAADVTGGIRGKAEAMLAIARAGADAGLISGLTDGTLSRALRGEVVYGSWARRVVG